METVQKPLIVVETTLTSSPLDVSLTCIAEYLKARLAQWSTWAVTDSLSQLTIDLGALGAGAQEKQEAREWKSRTAVYSLRLHRSDLLLGPLYRPATGKGPCPLCLERRWRGLRLTEEEGVDLSQQLYIFGHNPWITPFALETLWTLLEAILRQKPSWADFNGDQLSCLHLGTLTLNTYRLIADPCCLICAQKRQDEAPLFAGPLRPKRAISNYRLTEPAEYTLPIDGYLNPVCGMLGAIASPDHSNPVIASAHGKFDIPGSNRQHTVQWSGKGKTYSSSRLTGLLEGLERYSGVQPRARGGRVFECYDALGHHALDPRECGLHRPESYLTNPTRLVPFSTELKISWVWGYSFRNMRPMLVPEQLAYYRNPTVDTPLFIQDTSNGCASGSCLEEATLFGLWELIERDGVCISWYARLGPRRIDPWSCSNRYTLHLLDRIDRLGYDLHLLDTRFDMPVPSILAVAVAREQEPGTLALGAGANFDPEVAIHAALCEVGSLLSGFTTHVNSNLQKVHAMARDYAKVVSLDDHRLLYGLPEMAAKAGFLYQNPVLNSLKTCYRQWLEERPASINLRDDLTYCVDMLAGLGMDVIVVDQTSPEQQDVKLTTVKVIVPGLIPITFGWGKERLIDLPRLKTAPRAGGYLETDFDPAAYNRTPHPFA